jgi:hypothetical protein
MMKTMNRTGPAPRPRADSPRVEWCRGYYCAVAVLLREAGGVTAEVRSLYEQGGSSEHADAEDAILFRLHGLLASESGQTP